MGDLSIDDLSGQHTSRQIVEQAVEDGEPVTELLVLFFETKLQSNDEGEDGSVVPDPPEGVAGSATTLPEPSTSSQVQAMERNPSISSFAFISHKLRLDEALRVELDDADLNSSQLPKYDFSSRIDILKAPSEARDSQPTLHLPTGMPLEKDSSVDPRPHPSRIISKVASSLPTPKNTSTNEDDSISPSTCNDSEATISGDGVEGDHKQPENMKKVKMSRHDHRKRKRPEEDESDEKIRQLEERLRLVSR